MDRRRVPRVGDMDRRMLQAQPLSRDQVAAILRQRAERHMMEGGWRPDIAPPPPLPPPPMMPAAPLGADMMRRALGRARAFAAPAVGQDDRQIIMDMIAARLGGALQVGGAPAHPPFYRQASVSSSSPPDDDFAGVVRTNNVNVDGDIISYAPVDDHGGLYVGGRPLNVDGGRGSYFEVEILDKGSGVSPSVCVGVVPAQYPMDLQPGLTLESAAYCDGRIFCGRPTRGSGGKPPGPICDAGDRIGCGVRRPPSESPQAAAGAGGGVGGLLHVFFTKNGREIGNVPLPLQYDGFFPAVGLKNPGEEVSLRLGLAWNPEEDMMLVDGGEDEWHRLHDVKINGQTLEYVGRGKSLVDVGLAQAKTPICTRNHYFEIEIVDPGANCYIAIGLARRDYPKNRHPGWNKGSIAYHADDGKVFVGSGVGAPFGPRCVILSLQVSCHCLNLDHTSRCHKGDVMGCGVLFPRNYQCKSDSDEELEQQAGGHGAPDAGAAAGAGAGAGVGAGVDRNYVQIEELGSDSLDEEDEEEWWNDRVFVQSGVRVQVSV